MIGFYTDENVLGPIVDALRSRGMDVLTAWEDGRAKTDDRRILDRATELNRVLFSQDTDLLIIATARQRAGDLTFSGVIYASYLYDKPVAIKKPNETKRDMSTLIHERVRLARAGQNPTVICAMSSGWAVLGDAQFLPGYCLLLPDPVVPDLNALSHADRQRYLLDMTLIGDALLEVTDAFRINYEILGNTDPALHTHIFPRYEWEPDEFRKGPAFSYPRPHRASRPFDVARDKPLIEKLAEAIGRKIHEHTAAI